MAIFQHSSKHQPPTGVHYSDPKTLANYQDRALSSIFEDIFSGTSHIKFEPIQKKMNGTNIRNVNDKVFISNVVNCQKILFAYLSNQ